LQYLNVKVDVSSHNRLPFSICSLNEGTLSTSMPSGMLSISMKLRVATRQLTPISFKPSCDCENAKGGRCIRRRYREAFVRAVEFR
jgi:hypothetical protein